MSGFSLEMAGAATTSSGRLAAVTQRVASGAAVAHRRRQTRRACSATGNASAPPPPIAVTNRALLHLKKLKSDRQDDSLLLRIGVRSGGCSGMSYHMDFEKDDNVEEDDAVIEVQGGDLRMVCDPKSLLYLFGMSLDYSDALIGGGFQFQNPNATDTCGCGKSFGV
ncbi:unnamed protein product [Ostreobium quekettii]|uniref:Core domain-containing protein n=1 Tax=Ostreobium quekettii TaxID=121088 RepID=A0A8S1JG14_9CHLO|nr:unnamed protein product [Ostreobium quekettii]|eukprot:evm.model.scf_1606.3 EVM.evm.TU.scf_1606.3   scf_1606:16512-17422(-)